MSDLLAEPKIIHVTEAEFNDTPKEALFNWINKLPYCSAATFSLRLQADVTRQWNDFYEDLDREIEKFFNLYGGFASIQVFQTYQIALAKLRDSDTSLPGAIHALGKLKQYILKETGEFRAVREG